VIKKKYIKQLKYEIPVVLNMRFYGLIKWLVFGQRKEAVYG